MKIFLKGFCIVFLCMSLLGLLWFLIIQPGLTNREAQNLKEEYAQHLPGESSGEIPAGKEQPEPEFLVALSALQAEYPDVKGWISIPGTCVDYPVLQSSADDPEYYLRRTYKGEHRTAGSIFFQWDCSPESKNLVVYGHNMSDGTDVYKRQAPCGGCGQLKLRDARPCGRLQTYPAKSQKRPLHYVFQRGYPV